MSSGDFCITGSVLHFLKKIKFLVCWIKFSLGHLFYVFSRNLLQIKDWPLTLCPISVPHNYRCISFSWDPNSLKCAWSEPVYTLSATLLTCCNCCWTLEVVRFFRARTVLLHLTQTALRQNDRPDDPSCNIIFYGHLCLDTPWNDNTQILVFAPNNWDRNSSLKEL